MQILIAYQARAVDDAEAHAMRTLSMWHSRYEEWLGQSLTRTVRVGGPDRQTFLMRLEVKGGLFSTSQDIDGTDEQVLWYGMVEDLPDDTGKVLAALRGGADTLGQWTGCFLAASIHREELRVTASAVEPASAWYVSGPKGWAAGTRIRPLLDLVGRSTEPDLAAMSTFAAYGWTVGERSLFEGVRRLPIGNQLIGTGGECRLRVHTPLAKIFTPAEGNLSFTELVECGAERLRERVQREVELSTMPEVHLSAGRDSRMILAAGAGLAPRLTAVTYGSESAKETQIAASVARAGSVPHTHRERLQLADLVMGQLDRVREFMQWSEGTDKISHLTSKHEWFAPPAGRNPEIFFGMGGEINRGAFYRKYLKGILQHLPGFGQRKLERAKRDILRRRAERFGARPEACDAVRESFVQIDKACGDLGADIWTWLDMFYFSERVSHWGADTRSAKMGTNWVWTPLVDRQIIACGAAMSVRHRRHDVWPGAMIDVLQPAWHDEPYGSDPRAIKLLKATGIAGSQASGLTPATPAPDSERGYSALMWDLLLKRKDPVWPELVNPRLVESILDSPRETRKREKFLWQLATLELFTQAILP